MASIVWFLLMIILLVAEIAAPGFTTVWFAGGALAAMLLSLFSVPVFMQIIFFVQVSLVLLFSTRPFVKRLQIGRREKTNYEAVIGQFGKVTVEIDNDEQSGTVIIEGQEWSARSLEDQRIPVGSRVVVERITGVKVFVRREELYE